MKPNGLNNGQLPIHDNNCGRANIIEPLIISETDTNFALLQVGEKRGNGNVGARSYGRAVSNTMCTGRQRTDLNSATLDQQT